MEAHRKALGLPSTARALMITDGHSSRYSVVALALLKAHNIDLYLLPSHTSQVTQALDHITFAIFKAILRSTLTSLLKKSPQVVEGISSAALLRCHVLLSTLKAYNQAAEPTNTLNAFKNSGIQVKLFPSPSVTITPSTLASHFPDSASVFSAPLLPPHHTALYSCILNTQELIDLIKVAKGGDAEAAKGAWMAIANCSH